MASTSYSPSHYKLSLNATHRHRPIPHRLTTAVVASVLISAPLLLAMLPEPLLWPRLLAILTLAWWLPGTLLVIHWRLADLDVPTAALLAAGLGFCWMVLIMLGIHWLPGPISFWQLVIIYEIGAGALWLPLLWHRPIDVQTPPRGAWLWLAALLLLALLFRLPGLEYHELHVDEVVLLSRASEAIQGVEDAFARHTKGPGEIAVATLIYRALGTVNEATGRLPFALLSVGSVLALALLGRELFSWHAGVWAGILLTLNGFAIGLSRIVQYQGAILLLSVLTVLTGWRFTQQGDKRWLLLTATFATFGLVMHYEFALMTPALLMLVWIGWQRSSEKRAILRTASVAGVSGTLLLVGVYLPAYFNPYFSRTQTYLGNRLGELDAFNLSFFVEMGTFYNSIYFFVGLILLVIIGMILGWQAKRRQTVLLILWFLPYLVLYIFVMRYPGTHFYIFMTSWSLLAALPLAAMTQPTTSTAQFLVPSTTESPLASPATSPTPPSLLGLLVRWSALAFVILWLLVSANYVRLMFFQQTPEYLINYDKVRNSLYWSPYPIPQKPRFGFPIQAGWKTLGVLHKWGYLSGTYTSKDRSNHLLWYTGAFTRVGLDEWPDFVFVTRELHQLSPSYDSDFTEAHYTHTGDVLVRGEPRIEIWARDPQAVAYVSYDADLFARVFDQTVPVLEGFPAPVAMTKLPDATLGDTLTIDAAGLATTRLQPADLFHLALTWYPTKALAADYKLFIHVADDDGRPHAQWDGKPGLNTLRTSELAVGQAFTDHVLIRLPSDMKAGRYTILVGFYDAETGTRLGAQTGTQIVPVGTITVR